MTRRVGRATKVIPVTNIGLALLALWGIFSMFWLLRGRSSRESRGEYSAAWLAILGALVLVGKLGMSIAIRLGPSQCRYIDVEAMQPCSGLALLGMLCGGTLLIGALLWSIRSRLS